MEGGWWKEWTPQLVGQNCVRTNGSFDNNVGGNIQF